jgi:predicted membrane-bound spermidine synthase
MNKSTENLLNDQIKKVKFNLPMGFSLSMDILHLVVTGVASLFFICIFILVPLFYSSAGKKKWSNKTYSLIYFSSLGSGFIIIELVFTQLFLRLIGFPLYTFATVIFVLLLSAALGSYFSKKVSNFVNNRWRLPFYGVVVIGLFIGIFNSAIFNQFLSSQLWVRIIVASVIIFPLGFFLGMPFPLGIFLLRKQPKGAIAWAWGMNALFTVVGGYASVLLSIYLGFKETLFIALLFYVIAFVMFTKIRPHTKYNFAAFYRGSYYNDIVW